MPLLELANTHTPAHVVGNDELHQDGFTVVDRDDVDFVAIAQRHDMHARDGGTGGIRERQSAALLGVGVSAGSDRRDPVGCGRSGGLHLIFDRIDADAFRPKVDDAHVVHIFGGIEIAEKRASEWEIRANGEPTGARGRQVSSKGGRTCAQGGDSEEARQFFHVISLVSRRTVQPARRIIDQKCP